MAEKKRLRLQPSLPRLRKKREEEHQHPQAPEQEMETTPPDYEESWDEGGTAPADAPRGDSAEPEPKKHSAKKPGKPGRFGRPLEGVRDAFKPSAMQDKRLLAGIVILIAAVIVILIVMWVYPLSQPAPQPELSQAAVKAEMARLGQVNAFPQNENINPSDYPKAFGAYNGHDLQEIYFCSDVCPDYGAVYLIYKGVDPGTCTGLGKPVHDFSFGGYIGCEPIVG